MEFKWNYIETEKPICTETGNWDGKKSDEIIVKDFRGKHHIAVCYQGFMDGSDFCDFYTYDGEYQIDGVMHWSKIPETF